jgi:hypothetical protein
MKFNEGQTVKVSAFAFTNPHGGTGNSKPFGEFDPEIHDPIFKGIATVRVTKEWEDYECGQRGWAKPISANVKAYMKKNANAVDQRIFISEFDVVKVLKY